MEPALYSQGRIDERNSSSGLQEWPGISWWQQWQDHQLDQLIDQALQQSPSLDQAKARIQAAAALAEGQHATLKPSVQAEAKPAYERFTADEFIPPPYGANTYWDNQMLVESRFELDFWGKNHAALSAALDRMHATQAEAAQVEQVLISDLVDVYLQFALEETELRHSEAILHQQNRLYDLAQKRRNAGLGTDLDVNNALAAQTPVQEALARQKTAIRLLRNQIALLCGQPLSVALHLQRPVLSLTHTLHPPAQIPLHWLGRRPDIIADRWLIEADVQTIKVAKARFYPDINLDAYAGYQALGFSQLFSSSARMYGLTPALSLPLFEGGHLQGALDIAAAEHDANIARYNDQLLHAMQEVSDQLATLHGLDEEQRAATTAWTLARNDEELTRKGYQAGLMNETQQRLSSISRMEREQVRSRLDATRLRTEVHLIRALGGARQGPKTTATTVRHE